MKLDNNLNNLLTYLELVQNRSLKISKTTVFSIVYRFKNIHPIVRLCSLLNVSKGGYYK